jgi:hypothetical protein
MNKGLTKKMDGNHWRWLWGNMEGLDAEEEICSHLYRIAAGGHQGERVGTTKNLGFPRGVQAFILEVRISGLVWAMGCIEN